MERLDPSRLQRFGVGQRLGVKSFHLDCIRSASVYQRRGGLFYTKNARGVGAAGKKLNELGDDYAFSTKPALMALTDTHTRFVPPFAVLIRIR